MADTLVERITGQTQAAAVPITVNVVVSDQALLAGGHEPAWLQGYGPIPAEASTRSVPGAIRRLYAQPATGSLVAMESVARPFPTGLARFIELRDQTCRTPYCDAPIRHTTTPTTTQPADPPPPSTAKASANTATTPNKHPAGRRPAHQRTTQTPDAPSTPCSPPAT